MEEQIKKGLIKEIANMIKELVVKNRSYRRFDATHKISKKELEEFVDAARFCPSGANKQPLKYFISCDSATNNLIFAHLKWAAMLKEWKGPTESERPSAYIIITADKNIWLPLSSNDTGIAAQTIALAAVEKNLGVCMISNFAADKLKADIKLAENLDPLMVIAFGKPAEKILLEDTQEGQTPYYRDSQDNHHVPKRPLKELLIN